MSPPITVKVIERKLVFIENRIRKKTSKTNR